MWDQLYPIELLHQSEGQIRRSQREGKGKSGCCSNCAKALGRGGRCSASVGESRAGRWGAGTSEVE